MRRRLVIGVLLLFAAGAAGQALALCDPCCSPRYHLGFCLCKHDANCCYSFCEGGSGMCLLPPMPDCGIGARIEPPAFEPVLVAGGSGCDGAGRRAGRGADRDPVPAAAGQAD